MYCTFYNYYRRIFIFFTSSIISNRESIQHFCVNGKRHLESSLIIQLQVCCWCCQKYQSTVQNDIINAIDRRYSRQLKKYVLEIESFEEIWVVFLQVSIDISSSVTYTTFDTEGSVTFIDAEVVGLGNKPKTPIISLRTVRISEMIRLKWHTLSIFNQA